MNYLLLIYSLFFASMLNAQDTIVFADGKFKTVDVQVMDSLGNLSYLQNDKKKSIHQTEIIEYSNNGQWYSYQKAQDVFVKIEQSNYRLYDRIFDSKPTYTYGRFSIATNVFSPFFSADFAGNNLSERIYLTTNPSFSIEPAYLLSDYVAIKVPFYVGFKTVKPRVLENTSTADSYYENYAALNTWTTIKGVYNYYYMPHLDGEVEIVNSLPEYAGGTRKFTHARNRTFQTGICLKIYPFG